MVQIEKSQIRDIHVLGKSLGLLVPGSNDDPLHQLIYGITGKVSSKELSKDEAEQVLSELTGRMRLVGRAESSSHARKYEDTAGGMTAGQQRKVYWLMYQLQDLDAVPSTASYIERLCGIIKKEIGIDATHQEPFKWLDYKQGSKLIDAMNRYITNTAKKRARG